MAMLKLLELTGVEQVVMLPLSELAAGGTAAITADGPTPCICIS
jgi:hypothetical protein